MTITPRLRWLLALAVLAGCWMLLAEGFARLDALREDVRMAQARRAHGAAASQERNWMAESARARAAQLQWLSLLMEADTPGLLRVRALEHARSLCEQAKAAACQVSLAAADEAGAAATVRDAQRAAAQDPVVANKLRSVTIKLGFNFSPQALVQLLQRVEAGDRLARIDRLVVAGQHAELQMSFFGIEESAARSLRAAVSTGLQP